MLLRWMRLGVSKVQHEIRHVIYLRAAEESTHKADAMHRPDVRYCSPSSFFSSGSRALVQISKPFSLR